MKPSLCFALCLVFSFASACKGDGDTARGDESKSGEGAAKTVAAKPPPTKATPPRAELPADTGEHQGTYRWAARHGGNDADAGRALAQTPDGELLLAGYFKGKAPFGGKGETAENDSDGYLARLGKGGEVEWSLTFGGDGPDTVDAVASDPKGNAIVAGSFAGQLLVGATTFESAGADDMFIAKVGADGALAWGLAFGGSDIDAAQAVTTDAAGNVFVTGVYRGTVDFGVEKLTSQGNSDIFVLELSPAGEPVRVQSFGALGADYGRGLAFDSRGDLLLLGEFSRGVDFGGGELGSNGNRDVVLAKLGPDGGHRWSRSFGNNMDELAIGLAVDPADNVIVTGSFDDSLSFGGSAPGQDTPSSAETHQAAGRSDVFIAKYAPDGTLQWSRSFGGKEEDIGAAVATDEAGNVYATGWYWFEVDFGGGAKKSAGKKDAYLVKLSPTGEHLWSKRFGGKDVDFGKGLAVTGDGGVVVAGTFHHSIDFGGGVLEQASATDAMVPRGDIFVASFSR